MYYGDLNVFGDLIDVGGIYVAKGRPLPLVISVHFGGLSCSITE